MTEPAPSPAPQPPPVISYGWPVWYASLQKYREPSVWRSVWQLLNTLVPYSAILFLMIRSVRRGDPYAVTLALSVAAAAFLVRAFILFHDCVHGSLFARKGLNTFFGYALGVLAVTPFEDWRFSHLRHHATYANLDARGIGDIWTLTCAEYAGLSPARRLAYRLYRNPLVLFGFGALFSFLLRYRLPTRTARRKEHISVAFTNLLIAGVALLAARLIGWRTYLLVQVPVVWIAGALGVWLFYVQHQFAGVYWARKKDWDPLRAAMQGCSYYALPAVLRWFSANISYHDIHHLGARIPNYRLKECFDAIPALRAKPPLTIRASLTAARLKLWDEERQALVGFSRAAGPRAAR